MAVISLSSLRLIFISGVSMGFDICLLI
jgi:hypothetical protein